MKTRGLKKILTVIFAAALGGCGGGSTAGNPNTPIEDNSTSGAAAAAVGGALTGSNGSGALASAKDISARPATSTAMLLRDVFESSAEAGSSCPTTLTSSGLGCSASGDTVWLTFDDCSYGSAATYTGLLAITADHALSCGANPSPGDNGYLFRQYVRALAPTYPGSLAVESSFGTTSVIDDAVSNLGNFDGDTIATIQNSGYGALVNYGSGGARTGLTLGHRLTVGIVTDMSISGSVTVSEAAGATTRQVSGQVTVYHNLLKVVATSTFENVIHEDGCCLPTSGVVSTTFARGSSVAPTSDGDAAVGKTETLTFTGCGTGTLQTYSGQTESVTLSRCF